MTCPKSTLDMIKNTLAPTMLLKMVKRVDMSLQFRAETVFEMKKTSPSDIAKMDSLKIPKGGSSKPPSGSVPITVRFNAGEESLDDIFQSFHNSASGGGGGGGGGGGAGDSLSSSPQQQNPDEVNSRNNFLQGNFFNRKSAMPPPQQQGPSQPPSAKQQQLSPNHPCPPENSPFNGSQPGISNSISPNKYRRSISFPGKGSSPTPGYSLDVVPPGLVGNGAGGGGAGGDNVYHGYQDRCQIGNGIDMHSLNDMMRNLGVAAGSGGSVGPGGDAGSVADRLRGKTLSVTSDHLSDEAGNFIDSGGNLKLNSPSRSSPHSQGSEVTARYSRKVFVGGLPPDIDEDEITTSFRRFGPLVVDWPHKAESKSYFPPKGYAFLLFQDENSVQQLIESCITDDEKLYLCVSSPTIKDKAVQIRPWRLADADYVLDATMSLDPRKTVFVGGVPRPLKAFELAMIMDHLYGGVCYAGIDTDPELKYPKGAGRVAFSNQQSYISAISARFVQLQHGDIDKRVEVKPYVLDDQMCDECEGQRCGGKFAPFFCANVTCLQYYCEQCWGAIHSRPGREYHKPLVKEGADRPRAVPFRWC